MAYSAANIRTAIKELAQGSIGTTRVMTSNVFKYGAFDGQPVGATQAQAIHTSTHRFDVELGDLEDHEASPISAKAPTRYARLSISIPVWTHTPTTVDDAARRSMLAEIESDCDDLIQALHFRDNLGATAASGATNIISGQLLGPDGTGEPAWLLDFADWEQSLIRSQITAQATVAITQATS